MSKKTAGDSENLFPDGESPDDVTSIIGAIGSKTFKISVLIFILFIIINSDVFIDRILSDKAGTYVEGRHPTGKGTVIQGMLLSVGYILLHVLVSCDYI